MSGPIAYLTFKGECEAALNFYAAALGGKISRIHRYGESPKYEGMPPTPDNWIMHARIEWPGGGMLMGSDSAMTEQVGFKGISLSMNYRTLQDGERAFNALSDGARVDMPFKPTFWSPGFGCLVDKFGVTWMVNVEE